MNKTAIVIATVLTTMILLSVAGIAYAARAAGGAATDGAPASESVLLSDREAAYQAQIEEANQRLQEAQATQQALEAEINALQGTMQDPGEAGYMYSDDEHAEGGYSEEAHEEEGHREGERSILGFFSEQEDD